MKSFITDADIPIGYTVPRFPSLYWPVNNEKYSAAYLYHGSDIWKFTVFWTMIFFSVFYLGAGIYATFTHRKILSGFFIILTYLVVGVAQAFISGSAVGLILSAIYKSGYFSMSTWIPMCLGVAQILFVIITSYNVMTGIL